MGQFVLKQSGKVVRVLNWNSPKAYLIFTENQRLEIVATKAELDELDFKFEILGQVTQAQIKKEPFVVFSDLELSYDESVENIDHSIVVDEDDLTTYRGAIKWSGITHIAILVIFLLVGFLLKPSKEEIRVVKVIKQERIQIKKTKRYTNVGAKKDKSAFKAVKAKKRVTKKVAKPKKRYKKARKKVAIKSNRNIKKISKSTFKSKRRPGPQSELLAALGGGQGGKIGTSLKNVGKSGSRRNNSNGKGRTTKTLFGKGLVANVQDSSHADGVSRKSYGTRGRGGSGTSNYGKQNVYGGDSSGYSVDLYDQAIVTGGLSRDQIEAVVRRNEGQIRYCYEKGLQTNPKLSGTVTVDFTINGRGKVAKAKVSRSSLRSKQVSGCIISKLKGWRFPNPVGGLNVRVEYPFKLNSNSQLKLSQLNK